MLKYFAHLILMLCSLTMAQNSIAVVDSLNDVGMYSSIFVPADSQPIISYWDYSYRDLKVIKCGNSSCTSANIVSILDSAG